VNHAPVVVLRMGTHAEKEYFRKIVHLIDGLILGANLMESTSGATASLIVAMCGDKRSTPYFLDPMTYAFGTYVDRSTTSVRSDLDWLKSERQEKGKKESFRETKRSYKNLSKALGDPFEAAVRNGKALVPSDFASSKVVDDVTRAVVNYQLDRVREEVEKDSEYHSYSASVPKPAAVFAPYFYCEPAVADAWLTANVSFARSAANLKPDVPVHAVLCLDADALKNSNLLSRIRTELPGSGVQGVWLWFSRLLEDEAEVATLVALRDLVADLSVSTKVYNMHGGYFSLALSRVGLTGISHGVGYGEQKNVVPVIGQALPTVRYYLPAAHKKLGVPDIERCFRAFGVESPADFYAKVCDCVVCRGIVAKDLSEFRAFGEMQPAASGGPKLVQSPSAAKRCRFHFLVRRLKERDEMGRLTISQLQEGWDAAVLSWGQQPSLTESTKHLLRWRSAIK